MTERPRKTSSIAIRLSAAELRRLQRVSFQTRRTGGKKLSASEILRALIRLLEQLDVDLAGAVTTRQIAERLARARVRDPGGKKR